MNYKHLSEEDIKKLIKSFPSEENIDLLANLFKIFEVYLIMSFVFMILRKSSMYHNQLYHTN